MITREELARELRAAFWVTPLTHLGEAGNLDWLRVADRALELLAVAQRDRDVSIVEYTVNNEHDRKVAIARIREGHDQHLNETPPKGEKP